LSNFFYTIYENSHKTRNISPEFFFRGFFVELNEFLCHTSPMFEKISSKIESAKIVPVVKIDDEKDAVLLAESLEKGGMKAVEFAFRTSEGKSGIKKIARCIQAAAENCPNLLVGAGTVINEDLAKIARNSGAQFVVSPGFNRKTVEFALKKNLPVFPGVATPSEIESALSLGLNFLKLFPSEILGGVKFLKALKGPFPQVKFMPTGGISEENFMCYLECKNVGAVGGSWICSEKLIAEKNWTQIEILCKKSLSLIQ
jgi:2-dehydro-3-deoxyphosphogluconate aldolase/(4S)-4-hydroxy-2-oxoglutarate aldolase